MFNKFCDRFLPKYFRFWPTKYWLAIWCAPVRYAASKGIPARHDTAWKALRITFRHGDYHSRLIYAIKHGV
jgi:hypothetical protein